MINETFRPTTDEERARFKVFTDAVDAYLQASGWSAVVIGPVHIQQQPEHIGSLRYELVVKFLGGQKKTP